MNLALLAVPGTDISTFSGISIHFEFRKGNILSLLVDWSCVSFLITELVCNTAGKSGGDLHLEAIATWKDQIGKNRWYSINICSTNLLTIDVSKKNITTGLFATPKWTRPSRPPSWTIRVNIPLLWRTPHYTTTWTYSGMALSHHTFVCNLCYLISDVVQGLRIAFWAHRTLFATNAIAIAGLIQ